jgi:bifunctional non-homologous end joining protein LigD
MRLPRMDAAKLTLVREPFDHQEYLFELKHDGFRGIAYVSEGHCELVSRRRNSYKTFAELRRSLGQLKAQTAILDGEIVCLNSSGISIFNELLRRKGWPAFYAFDLLYLNGADLRQLSLLERKAKLRKLIERSRLPDVICAGYIEERGIELFREVSRRNLEGIVAKRKAGTYAAVSGWLKIKNPTYTQSEKRHELFESFKSGRRLAPVPKKPPLRSLTLKRKVRRRKLNEEI